MRSVFSRLPFLLWAATSLASVAIGSEATPFYKDSAWKPRALLPAADALRGDFWPASPNPNVNYDDPDFDESRLERPPAPGEHPRVLVTPGDVEKIREKVAMGDKAPAAFRVMWARVQKNKGPFYALVAQDDALGKQLAAELVAKMQQLEPKLDKLDARPDRDNLWIAERSIVASGDPDPPTEMWAMLDYDYLWKWMSPTEREQADRIVARLTKGRISNFMTYPDHFMINNHQGFGMEYIRLLLLIEGQKGFDPQVYNLAVKKARAMLDWYLDADGMCYESIKGWLNASAFVAIGRRERDFLKHSHLRAKMNFFSQAIHWQDGRWQIRDEMRASAFHVIWMMHYFHPNDLKLDWLYSATFTSHDFLTNPEARWPGPVGTSDELLLLFANDGMKDASGKPLDWTDQKRIDELKLPTVWKDDTRGYMIARNSWNKEDIQLGFTCKQDFYYGGHEGSETNRFILWSDGVNWVRDSNMLAVKATFLQNMLTVDGKGLDWPPAPGVWLGVEQTPDGVAAAGDGKVGYSYSKVMQVHPLDSPSVDLPYYTPFAAGNYTLTRDIQVAFHPGTIKWNDGFAHTDYGPWSGETRLVEGYKLNNPMEQAYRTVYLSRGEHPYVLVLDDARKDGASHLYEWNMTVPEGIDLIDARVPEINFQAVPPSNTRESDLILGSINTPTAPNSMRKLPKKGDPLLLVRTLWRNSKYGFPVPRFERIPVEPQIPYAGLSHVTVPAISESPEFRIMLYPHKQGDPIPVTEWNEDRTELTVTIGKTTDLFRFGKGNGGRTVFSVDRNGKRVFQSAATPERPQLEVRGTPFNADDLRTTRMDGVAPVYKFDDGVDVTLTRPVPPAYVAYTLDGSMPSAKSPRYTAPIRIDKACKLTACRIDPSWTAGPNQSEPLIAEFQAVTPARASTPPEGSRPGLLARVYEKKTVLYNDRGFFDASRCMLPNLDSEKPVTTTVVPGFQLPYVTPVHPQKEQSKGFYRFNGWINVSERAVYEFAVDSCGPVAMTVGGQEVVRSAGVFHQQQSVRRGECVLDAGWQPVELVVCDPLLWNINTAGEMPFAVTVRKNGGEPAAVSADAFRCTPAKGEAIADAPKVPEKEAGKPSVWMEPGLLVSVYRRENKDTQPDYFDIDKEKPIQVGPVAAAEVNLRPTLVRVYDAWFQAPQEGEYRFELESRKAEGPGLGDLRAAFQNQLRIDGEIVVQHGVPGPRPLGKIRLKAGWHQFSLRLGSSPASGLVTYPDGQVLPLKGLDFQRPAVVDIRPEGVASSASLYEIYARTNLLFRLPEGVTAKIRYTLDGSEPTAQSPEATAPVALDRTAVVTACAFLPDGTQAGRQRVEVNLVKIPVANLIGSAVFTPWNGKTGIAKTGEGSTLWISPGAKSEEGSLLVNSNLREGSPSTLNINVARPAVSAGLKFSDLKMSQNAITVGARFKTMNADGQFFGKDGINAFGKAYKVPSVQLRNGKVGSSTKMTSPTSVPAGQWVHLVFTANANESKLYLDGKVIAQGKGSETLVTDALDFFTGNHAVIKEVRIYDRVLSDEDVRQWSAAP